MKNALLLVTLSALSLTRAIAQPSIVFSKYFDFDSYSTEGVYKIVNVPNGYLFTSIRALPDTDLGVVDLVQTDFHGELIFRDTILGTSFLDGVIYDSSDKSIVITGTVKTSDLPGAANDEFQAILIKRSLEGETIWRQQYKSTSTVNFGRDVVKLPDGGFMILGDRGKIDSASAAFLMRTDAEGDMLWTKDYGQNYKYNHAWSLMLSSDTTVVFVAQNRFLNLTIHCASGMVKTDLDGNIIWENHIKNTDCIDAVVGDMLQNGDFVLNTSIDTLCDGCIGNGPLVVCLSPEGEVKWQRFFLYRILEFVSINGTSDGGVLLCAYGVPQDIGQIPAASFLIKLSAEGEVLWERVINTENQLITPQANTAIEAADGGFLMGATQARYHNNGATIEQDAWLLKLGEDGCFVPDCDDTLMIITPAWEPPADPEEKEKWRVKVYPNPAQDFVTVTTNENALPIGGQIIISDFLGKRVREVSITVKMMRISTADLPGGAYFVQVFSAQGQLLGASKLLIHK
jgi:hypothetical protein